MITEENPRAVHRAARRASRRSRSHRPHAVERAPDPLDLRLAAPAALTWLTAWLLLAVPAVYAWMVWVLAAVSAGGGLVALARALVVDLPRHRADSRPGSGEDAGRWQAPASSMIAVLCAALAATSLVCAATLALRARDPVSSLAALPSRVSVEGFIAAPPRPAAGRSGTLVTTLDLTAIEGRASRARIVVMGGEAWRALPVGSLLRTRVKLRATPAGQRAQAIAFARDGPQIVAGPQGMDRLVNDLHAGLRQAAKRWCPAGTCAWPEGSGELVVGVTLGDDSRVPERVRAEMRTTSLTHLSAVSGQHVALVVGLVLACLGWLPRRGRSLLAALVLAALVVLVGPSGSVLRAAVMGIVTLIGVGLGRQAAAIPALSAATLLLILLDPWQSRDWGLALSVTATAAIVLGSKPVADCSEAWLWRRLGAFVRRWHPRAALATQVEAPAGMRILAQALAVPCVAQAACSPLLVVLQGSLSPWAVLTNLLAAPVVGVVTIAGLAATLLAPVSAMLASWAVWPALAGCAWLVLVAHWGAGLPLANLAWPAGMWGAAGLIGVMVCCGSGAWLLVWARRMHRAHPRSVSTS